MEEIEVNQQPEAVEETAAPEQIAETVPEQIAETAPEQVSEIAIEASAPVPEDTSVPDATLKALIEAVIYITDEPLEARQIAGALAQPLEKVQAALDELVAEYAKPEHGLTVRELAGGYKMATKAEHHEAVRAFVKSLKPPLKLSLAALETLAVIAYKQPITGPEILEIRGVQGAGVLKTLVDRKLIATSGRKNVVGKPILYKTTKDFLIQFGLKDLLELPTLKEFEELGRLALNEGDPEPPAQPSPEPSAELAPSSPAPEEATADAGPGTELTGAETEKVHG